MILSKAVEGYLLDISATYSKNTVVLYRGNLQLLVDFLQDPELGEITHAQLTQFITFLRNEYRPRRLFVSSALLSPSAVDNYWKSVRSFFGWCNKVLALPRPDENLSRPRFRLPEVSAFSQDEVKRILDMCDSTVEITVKGKRPYRRKRPTASRDRAMILFLLDTGLRLGEVSRLTVGDIDLATGEVIVAPYGTGQKTKPRMIYVGKAVKRAIWIYLSKENLEPSDPLFSSSPKYIRGIVRSLGTRAKVSHCHPHRFRHTFATEFLRNRGDPFTLQRLLGHSTLEMVRHYLDIVEADKKAAHQRSSPADNWKL